jgi:feruloyl esterase
MAVPCENLTSVKFTDGRVTLAQTVAPGTFAPPGANPQAAAAYKDLPAFCRVALTLTPSSDSDIRVEVWLPVSGWNGKFQGVGNGGWAGSIGYGALAEGVRRGYAAASTDTGHQSDVSSASFALGHPEKLVDFAWRAIHEMTVKGKEVTKQFYAQPPQYSYFLGCSGGGKQGLSEAQRFPDDYDAIAAGATANNMVRLHAAWIRIAQAVHKDPASYIPPEKYSLIHDAVLQQCDAMDGVKDGLLENPQVCKFDPKVLQCKAGDAASCLTAKQTEAAQQIFASTIHAGSKRVLMPGLLPGSEAAWGVLAGPLQNDAPASRESSVADNTYKYVIFKDPKWDFRTLNFDKDIDFAEKTDNGLNDANDPNLKPFFASKGKLLMYHGYADQIVPPQNSINYYNSVVKTVGAKEASDSIRLFMAPGMQHCRGGDGPNEFDLVGALEQWVERGKAPDSILATHRTSGKVDRTRPLCSYPQVAKYKGTGSIDEAANFQCVAP